MPTATLLKVIIDFNYFHSMWILSHFLGSVKDGWVNVNTSHSLTTFCVKD